MNTEFSRKSYLGSDLDRTLGYVTPTGEHVNGNQSASAEALRASARRILSSHVKGNIRILGKLPGNPILSSERHYLAGIAALAAPRHVKLIFVRSPMYMGELPPDDVDLYRRYGPVVTIEGLSGHPEYFWNGGHLNRRGAVRETGILVDQVAQLLR